MFIETTTVSVSALQTDLLVLLLDENAELFSIDDELLQEQVQTLKQEYAEKKRDSEYWFTPRHLENIGAVIVYPTAMNKGMSLWESVKMCAAKALQTAASTRRNRVTIALNSSQGQELAGQIVEGALVSTWSYNKYKKDAKDDYAEINLSLAVLDPEAVNPSITKAKVMAAAVNEARRLTIEPGEVIYPETLAAYAQQMAQDNGLEFAIWDEQRLAEEGFVGHIHVGSGSCHAPRMFALTYNPTEESDVHLAFVGKGITFDSGGISLKPSADMFEMKGDMGGAAAVIGAMHAIAQLRPDIKVTGIIVSAENMPGSKAQRPGDIITYKNGTSVHVENTDAEGRLVLADGLILAGEMGATHVLDIATLSGGCVRALGEGFTGLMGTNRKLVNAITMAGGDTGESFWKFPLPLEYREMLKTPYADITNSAGPLAAAITAGLFLKEFAPAKTPWAHLDIAGTAWHAKKWKYYVPGPSGVGVRTLTELACKWAQYLG